MHIKKMAPRFEFHMAHLHSRFYTREFLRSPPTVSICGLHRVTLLRWSPIFQRYMALFVIKNEHKRYMSDEIGLCAHDVDTI
jgi:hypothetical protein